MWAKLPGIAKRWAKKYGSKIRKTKRSTRKRK